MLSLQTKNNLTKKNYCGLALMAALMPFSSILSANVSVENDVRLSDMGPDGDVFYDARDPATAYNSRDNELLVVWVGDDDSGSLVDGEKEIFGQRIDAETGVEIGNDFRLSDMGTDGLTNYYTYSPVVSYNPINNEYFVVWAGTDNSGLLVAGETEIFGQRIDAATGTELGVDIRLSNMGPDGDTSYDAFSPALTYNIIDNEYFVVWSGSHNTDLLVAGEFEIYGQSINAATGEVVGGAIRLSDMGSDGDMVFDAISPDVAYNSVNHEYYVVWSGDDDSGLLVDGENEIYGQRIDAATGAELGNDFRLTSSGPDGDATYDAVTPAVAYNENNNQYMVVWSGDLSFTTGFLFSATTYKVYDEIFSHRIDAATGEHVEKGFSRISRMGTSGNDDYPALKPAISYNFSNDTYMVVWYGADYRAGLVDGEYEIFSKGRIGTLLPNPFSSIYDPEDISVGNLLSDMGQDGDISFSAYNPSVAYNSANNEHFVVWHGDDDTAPLINGELEIFGERFVGSPTVRLSTNNLTVGEATGSVQVEVQLIGNIDPYSIISVNFYSEDGSAKAISDYSDASTQLIFQPGETSKIIEIEIYDNDVNGGDKTINLSLVRPDFSTFVYVDRKLGAMVLTIVDDEGAIIEADNNAAVDEGEQTTNSSGGSGGGGLTPVSLLALILIGLWRNRSLV